jgi:hypothetical protein
MVPDCLIKDKARAGKSQPGKNFAREQYIERYALLMHTQTQI